jgi:hypothetical protein
MLPLPKEINACHGQGNKCLSPYGQFLFANHQCLAKDTEGDNILWEMSAFFFSGFALFT